MDRSTKRWILMNVVRPPLLVLGFVMKPISLPFGLLFGLLDRTLARRDERRLGLDIAEAMPFLFADYGGRIVPNEGVPFPPGFDYAFVTVAVDNLLIRFCRGRGDLDLYIGSKTHPRDLQELGLVLGLLDKQGDHKRWGIVNLRDAAQVLKQHMNLLKRGLGRLGGDSRDEELVRGLGEVVASDRIAIRQAEWEINKRLG
jgi:hypothetical protein